MDHRTAYTDKRESTSSKANSVGRRHAGIRPARHALNPILLDAPVIDADGSRASVFLTPASVVIENRMPVIIALAAGVFLLAAFITSKTGAAQALTHLLTLFAFAIAALPAVTSLWQSLHKCQIDIDMLMLLGAGLAAIIGSPMEGALLLFLFALSGAMEEYALGRTQQAIVSLHNLIPDRVIVLVNGTPHRVAIKRVSLGERVLVRPGDNVPLDGTIVEGSSAVNEAAITGESVPRDKGIGDRVYAGTANVSGRLVVEVNKTSGDTTLARIVRLVTQARNKRAGVQRLIDRIGPIYSTSVILLSLAVGFGLYLGFGITGREAVRRAIAVLIVCSPCALIIATPVAYLAAIGSAALQGVLIKGGLYLETLARARAVVFDKTGTLTTGRIRLAQLITHNGITEDEALRLAGAIESASSHPMAGAVMRRLTDRRLEPHEACQLHSVPGQGTSATSNGHSIWIGRPSLASRYIDAAHRDDFSFKVESVYRSGRAASALVIDGAPNILIFEDTLRCDARDTLSRLRSAGIHRIDMLTGDHELVASSVARELDIDGYRADLLPQDKLTVSEELRKRHGVMVMVGDGVNDAPALAAADVGIAIGSLGADIALDAADIVLMNNNLDGVAWVRAHALRTARIVRQNLTLAIGVVIILAGFAVTGNIPLPLAVIGHEGSTVLVALNALRLLESARK